jgi:hypothetical protein
MVVGFEEGLKGVAVWELGVIAAVDMRSLIEPDRWRLEVSDTKSRGGNKL